MLSYFRFSVLLVAAIASALPLFAGELSSKTTSSLSELAETGGYTRGLPEDAIPVTGDRVYFLRSGPRDTFKCLYELSVATGVTRKLLSPVDLGNVSLGIPSFQVSSNSREILIPYFGRVFVLSTVDKKLLSFQQDDLVDPVLAPSGKLFAAVENNELVTVDITTGRLTRLTHDNSHSVRNAVTTSFDRSDFGRYHAFWWSPDSTKIAYIQSEAPLPAAKNFPDSAPAARLGVVDTAGGPTVWAKYSSKALPFIGRVVWNDENAPLSAVLFSRSQRHEELVAITPSTGTVRTLLSESDPDWISDAPDLAHRSTDLSPYWLSDGSGFLWLSQEHGDWQIEVRNQRGSFLRCATPPGLQVRSIDDLNEKTGVITFEADPDARQCQIYRTDFKDSACVPLTHSVGIHRAVFSSDHSIFADTFSLDDAEEGTDIFSSETGYRLARISSLSALPVPPPNVKYFRVGVDHNIDAAVVMPSDLKKGQTYPVLLNVNVTSGISSVTTGVRAYYNAQWYANQGYIVVFVDGRGSPDRGKAYERGIDRNILMGPVTDQASALDELARVVPEIDMSRVAVIGTGISGSVALAAPTQRPYYFTCGVAISPVIDWDVFDPILAERYLGALPANSEIYSRNSIIDQVQNVQRPLLVLESSSAGLQFDQAVKFSELLYEAGKPIDFVPIKNDPVGDTTIADQVALHMKIISFLNDHLKH